MYVVGRTVDPGGDERVPVDDRDRRRGLASIQLLLHVLLGQAPAKSHIGEVTGDVPNGLFGGEPCVAPRCIGQAQQSVDVLDLGRRGEVRDQVA